MTKEFQTDVACIGGGPACAFAAMEILKTRQYSVEIFEEHEEIGVPVNCAGLISVSGFKKLKIKVPKDCIQHKVKGSIFYSPTGHRFEVSRKKVQAHVIDRAKFDKFLISKVEEMDGKVHLGRRVTSIIKKDKQAIGLKVNEQKTKVTVKSKIIINGEGVRTTFIQEMGLSPTRRDFLVPAIQYDLKNVEVDEDFVEIYIGRCIAPGFFAYIIPLSENEARVAVGSKFGKPADYLKHFIFKHPIASPKLKNGTIYKKGGGFIHLGGPIKKTYTAGFMGVGDSVGQVKATTGGGVVFGGLCAKIAGKIAVEAIERDDFSENSLKNYQTQWQKLYLRELKLMRLLRSVLDSVPDKFIDEVFVAISKQGIPELIEEIGDMDMQGALIKRVLFSPRILNIGLSVLSGIFLH